MKKNTATIKVHDEMTIQFISNKENDKEIEIKLIDDDISTLCEVYCGLCKINNAISQDQNSSMGTTDEPST
ncbi:unnamed protein product, partial [Rotaria sordida]